LDSYDCALSFTGANRVALDPYTLGGEMYSVASIFSQYRIVSGKFRYRTIQTISGTNNSPSGAAANSASRTFSLAFLTDPAAASTTFSSDLSSGGQVVRSSEDCNIAIPPSSQMGNWLYTSSAAASPTSIDLRDCAFGALEGHFFDTSSTAIVQYGFIVFDAVVQFRGLMYFAAPIGKSLKNRLSLEQKFSVDCDDFNQSFGSGPEEKADTEQKTPSLERVTGTCESPVHVSAFDADSFPPSVRRDPAVVAGYEARTPLVKALVSLSIPSAMRGVKKAGFRKM